VLSLRHLHNSVLSSLVCSCLMFGHRLVTGAPPNSRRPRPWNRPGHEGASLCRWKMRVAVFRSKNKKFCREGNIVPTWLVSGRTRCLVRATRPRHGGPASWRPRPGLNTCVRPASYIPTWLEALHHGKRFISTAANLATQAAALHLSRHRAGLGGPAHVLTESPPRIAVPTHLQHASGYHQSGCMRSLSRPACTE
jgi:hypothetical protein